jgi:isopenicillin-N epimerase
MPPGSALRRHWALDPDVVFLNHGSFGACPRAVLEAQSRLRMQMEAEPVRFFVRELEPLLDEARSVVASFLGAETDDVVFVRNATSGVNAVLRSLRLAPGDELLTTDHAYGACKNALEYVARAAGAQVVVARSPFPLSSSAQAVAALLGAVTERTRFALIDHVTSPTGLVLPVVELARALAARGVEVLVDGAHAPGMLDFDDASESSLRALGRAGVRWYTANFHKWTCAPKGAGVLWARADAREHLHPTSISHGYRSERERSRFLEEFDWTGTDDPTPWLCVPEALRVIAGLHPDGWPGVRAKNRALALAGRAVLCETLGIPEPAPASMIGALAAVPIPWGRGGQPLSALYMDPLQVALYDRHRIEVPIVPWPAAPERVLRVSAHLHNTIDDYARLAEALIEELERERAAPP